MTRPKRLWVALLVNVAAGALTNTVIGYLFAKSGIVIVTFVSKFLICGVLILSSVLALLGYGRYRWIALGAAILFFGIHLIQSLWFYYHPSPALPWDTSSLASSVERNSLGIVLNLWAFLSDKTDTFFDAVGPNNRSRGP